MSWYDLILCMVRLMIWDDLWRDVLETNRNDRTNKRHTILVMTHDFWIVLSLPGAFACIDTVYEHSRSEHIHSRKLRCRLNRGTISTGTSILRPVISGATLVSGRVPPLEFKSVCVSWGWRQTRRTNNTYIDYIYICICICIYIYK